MAAGDLRCADGGQAARSRLEQLGAAQGAGL